MSKEDQHERSTPGNDRPLSIHTKPGYLESEYYIPILKELSKTKRAPGIGDFGQENLRDLITYADGHSEDKTTIYVLKGPPRVGKSYRLALVNGYIGLREKTLVTDWENAMVDTLGYMPRNLITPEERNLTNETLDRNVVELMRRTNQKPKNIILETPGTAIPITENGQTKWIGNNRGDELVGKLITHTHELIPEPYNIVIADVTSGGALHEVASLTRILSDGVIPRDETLERYIKLSELPIPQTLDKTRSTKPQSASPEQMKGIDFEIDEQIRYAQEHGIVKVYSEKELRQYAEKERVFEDAEELGVPVERMLEHFVKHFYLGQINKYTLEQYGITADSPWVFIGLSNPRPYELSNYDLRHLTAIRWLLDRST